MITFLSYFSFIRFSLQFIFVDILKEPNGERKPKRTICVYYKGKQRQQPQKRRLHLKTAQFDKGQKGRGTSSQASEWVSAVSLRERCQVTKN